MDATVTKAPSGDQLAVVPALAAELRRCFQQQRFDHLAELYHPDATFELHVGPDHDRRRGAGAIVERYAADYAAGVAFLRWDARPTGWGAVIEAEALQTDGGTQLWFRWVHLLDIVDGKITGDIVYCTGGVPTSAPSLDQPGDPSPPARPDEPDLPVPP